MADEQAQRQETKVAPQPEKKSGFLKMVMIVLLATLIAGGAGYYFYGKQLMARFQGQAEGAEEESQTAPIKKTAPKKSEEKKEIGPTIALEPFLFNLGGSYSRIAKVSVALEVKDAKVAEETKKMMPIIRDKMLSVLAAKTPETLMDVAGRNQIKGELRNEIKGLFKPEELQGVYITDIIMQ